MLNGKDPNSIQLWIFIYRHITYLGLNPCGIETYA